MRITTYYVTPPPPPIGKLKSSYLKLSWTLEVIMTSEINAHRCDFFTRGLDRVLFWSVEINIRTKDHHKWFRVRAFPVTFHRYSSHHCQNGLQQCFNLFLTLALASIGSASCREQETQHMSI